MQSKVSMVVPCYNKVRWIDSMLQSVYDQTWNNIEVILVNDGSTDGTREVMAEWVPKLQDRGYEVIVIDQENQGMAASVLNGMRRMSGDYFCTMDCDDRIVPEYFTIMAGWLDDHSEYDGVTCAFVTKESNLGKEVIWEYTSEDSNRLENFILRRMQVCACIYLTRVSYIKRCGVVDNFDIASERSQEASLGIPLLGNDGKFKHIHKGLYLYNLEASDTENRFRSFEKAVIFFLEFCDSVKLAVLSLNKDAAQKEKLLFFAELGRIRFLLTHTDKFDKAKLYHNRFVSEALFILQQHFYLPVKILSRSVTYADSAYFFNAISRWLLHEPAKVMPRVSSGIVIGYGALGKMARKLLPHLSGTPYFPEKLWDISACNASVYSNIQVTKPNFESLTSEDILLVFPYSTVIREEVEKELLKIECTVRCVYYEQIFDYIGTILFPELT